MTYKYCHYEQKNCFGYVVINLLSKCLEKYASVVHETTLCAVFSYIWLTSEAYLCRHVSWVASATYSIAIKPMLLRNCCIGCRYIKNIKLV